MSDKDLKILIKLFKEMAEHLDYCGYGDSWERECAEAKNLPQRVGYMLAKLNKGDTR